MSFGGRYGYKLVYSLFISFTSALLLTSVGCGGTSSGGMGTPGKTLLTIAASPATADLSVGAAKQFNATATYSDGSTQDVTASAAWTDTSPAVAKVTASGMVTALAAGSTTVTATLDGVSGSADLTVSAAPKTLTTIAVTPATATIAIGATQQFTATAKYNDGTTANVTTSATWSSSNSAIAKIAPSGVASALATGSATITATLSGVSGTATVTVPVPVVAKTLTSVAVSPATPSIAIGATQQFVATATYSDSTRANVTTSASWTSSNPAIAKVTSAGLASALAGGSATITATIDGVSGSSSLTVPPPAVTKTLTSIAITPAAATFAIGATQQFIATATYSDTTTANVTTLATWTSSNPTIAKITPGGLASALAAGSATITATFSGVSGSASLTVPPPATTLASIAVTPATASIVAKATQQFIATAFYSDHTTADVTATATWTSSNRAVATVAAAGLATGVAAGTATVTATLTGVAGGAALTVTPSLTAVSVTPTAASLNVGATQQFTAAATYSDGSTHNVTATAQWSVASTAVATINPAGLATAVASGSTPVTASFGGMTGTATLNVRALTSISISPATATFLAGSTQQFTATATYTDGTTADITSTATWSVASTAIATINPSGLATGVASGSTSVTAAIGAISGTATFTVTALPTIAITPSPSSIVVGATQQFTATATYSDGTTADVTATATWSVANTAVATIDASGLATAVASGTTTVTASSNGSKGTASLAVTLPAPQGVNVTTWHFDNNRSGLNPNETSLTPVNVAPATFGKLFSYLVDGYAYAEPLFMSNVTINGATHNVLYVATESDTVYAFDADKYGAPLWQISLLNSGETPLTGASVLPNQGVTSTPVIDPATNTIYVVSAQKSASNGPSYRLNALDIVTGSPKLPAVTIQASVPGTNSTAVGGNVSLPGGCVQRAALLLANGNLYLGFGSCHSGWLLAYDTKTLNRVGVFNSSPNLDGEGTYGGAGGVWMGSGGPIADANGNIYVSTGNGPYDGSTAWGDSILKFSPTLQLLDHFTPADFQFMNCNDSDLAAGGLLMIPGSGQIVGGGKMGKLYLVNTASLGGEQPGDAGAAQTTFVETGLISSYTSGACTDNIPAPNTPHTAMVNSYEIFGTPAYFNGSIYLGVTPTSPTAPAVVRRFAYSSSGGGSLAAQEFTSPDIQLNTRGTTPFMSANGTSSGILWMIDEGQPVQTPDPGGPTSATLRAYDAQNLAHEIYDSSMNSTDVPGYGIKFSSPIVANGKVYISTGHDPYSKSNPNPNPQGEIDVYGLK
jgi:uncharacterized protein YjdB